MALTKIQEISLFQILEVPYSVTVGILLPDDNLTSIEKTADNLEMQAYAKIQSRITAVEGDADLSSILEDLLDQWYALGVNTTTLDAGGFANITGVTDNPDADRILIRSRVLVIIPMYRCHEEMTNHLSRNMSAQIVR